MKKEEWSTGYPYSKIRYWLFRVTVTGESMWPVLVPGRTYWASSLVLVGVGSIVVARTSLRTIVKCVNAISGDTFTLQGTQEAIPIVTNRSQILGKVLVRSTNRILAVPDRP